MTGGYAYRPGPADPATTKHSSIARQSKTPVATNSASQSSALETCVQGMAPPPPTPPGNISVQQSRGRLKGGISFPRDRSSNRPRQRTDNHRESDPEQKLREDPDDHKFGEPCHLWKSWGCTFIVRAPIPFYRKKHDDDDRYARSETIGQKYS